MKSWPPPGTLVSARGEWKKAIVTPPPDVGNTLRDRMASGVRCTLWWTRWPGCNSAPVARSSPVAELSPAPEPPASECSVAVTPRTRPPDVLDLIDRNLLADQAVVCGNRRAIELRRAARDERVGRSEG